MQFLHKWQNLIENFRGKLKFSPKISLITFCKAYFPNTKLNLHESFC